MFLDSVADAPGSPVLLIGVDQKTPRSQFLAHFSFTTSSAKETGLRMTGGTIIPGSGYYDVRRIYIVILLLTSL